jgi:hypothetical protein
MKSGLLVSILAQRRFVAAALVSLAAYAPDWRSLAFRQPGADHDLADARRNRHSSR